MITGQQIARATAVVALILLGGWMLERFLPALLWAGVIATATWPLRQYFERQGLRPDLVATLLTLVLTGVLIVPFVILGIELARESSTILESLRQFRQSGVPTPSWVADLPLFGEWASQWWEENLGQPGAAQDLLERLREYGLFGYGRTVGQELVSRVTVLAFTLLTLFFLYRDGASVAENTRIVGDSLFGPGSEQFGKTFLQTLRATINGLVLVGLAQGVLLGIAYRLTGFAHPVWLGLTTAVFATVPFGAPLVFILCGIDLFIEGQPGAAIALVGFGAALTFIADHFVRPFLIGGSTRLPFLWVLLGILGGLETFGLVGLFLGPAIISVLIAIWREATAGKPGELSFAGPDQPELGNRP
jgi:predicted PurR-regulated permease PerM